MPRVLRASYAHRTSIAGEPMPDDRPDLSTTRRLRPRMTIGRLLAILVLAAVIAFVALSLGGIG